MAVQPMQQSSQNIVRWALRLDSVFDGVLGVVLIAGAEPIAEWVGIDSPMALVALGIILILFATGMVYQAVQAIINRQFVQIIMSLNFIWAIGSGLALVTDTLNLTAAGNQAAVIIAVLVAFLAEMQWWGLRQQ